MTTATHKAQLEVTANGDGLQAVAAAGKRSLRDLGQAARDASRDAADGIREIGRGGDDAARRVDGATKAIERSLERTIAQLEAGERGSRKFFESLAASRGADVARLQPLLDQLDAVRARTEAAAAAEKARAAEATAAAQRTAAAEQALANIRAAAQRAEREAYQHEQAALAAAQQQRAAFIAGLERQVNALGKTRAELLQMQAAEMGVATQAAPLIQRLREAEEAGKAAGAGVGQAAFALRMIPMQMTDVVTSLVGGQSAFMVLIQQGGQIKDAFGGIGPALRGVAGYVAGLVNPFTVAAAVTGTLALAHHQGAAEILAYKQALVLTGNAAGVTTSELQASAQAISTQVGTQSAAAEALTALVNTGRVGAAQLTDTGLVAVKMQRELGISVTDTAQRFSDLGRDPLQASLKLNEQYRYLTVAVLEQIDALQRQGRVTDAAAVAQQAFAQAMSGRMDTLTSQLGTVERAWRFVADQAKGAWDAMLNVGRPQSLKDQLVAAQQQLAALQAGGRPRAYVAGGAAGQEQAKAAVQEDINSLSKRLLLEDNARQYEADKTRSVEAANRFRETSLQYLTREQQKQEKLNQLRQDAIDGGYMDTPRYKQAVRGIESQFDEHTDVVAVQRTEQQRLEVIKRAQDQINLLRATGYINERTQIEEIARLDIDALDVRKQALQAQRGIAKQDLNGKAEVARLDAQIADVEAQMETRRLELSNAVTEAKYKQAKAAEAVYEAERQEGEKEKAARLVAEAQAREQLYTAMYEQRRALDEQVEADQLELSLMGASSQRRQAAIQQLRIEQQLRREIDRIKRTPAPEGKDAEQWRADLIAEATDTATRASAEAGTRVYLDEWQRMSDQLASSLTDDIMRGGKSGLDYLKDYARTLVLRPIVSAVMQPFAAAVSSVFAPNGGGGGSLLGTVGNAASAARTGMTLGSNLGSLASTAGSWLGSSSLSAYGAGMGMTAAEVAAASEAYAAAGMAEIGSSITAGSSLGGSLSTLGPYAAAAAAIYMLASGLDDSGTPHTGGGAYADAYGSSVNRGVGFSLGGGDATAAGQAYAKQTAQSVSAMLNGLSTLGIRGNFGVATAFADDSSSDGAWGGLRITRDGQKLVDWEDTRTSRWAPREFADGQEGQAQYLAELGKSVRSVLDNIGLPDWAQEMVQSLGDAPTLQQLASTADAIVRTEAVLKSLGESVKAFNGLSGSAKLAVLQSAGGIDAFATAMNNYLGAIYSDAERLQMQREQLAKQFRELGLSVPSTAAAYRRLVEAQDLTTEHGREVYVSLLQLAGAFGEITSAAETAGSSLREEIDRLRGLDGSSATNPAALWVQFAMQTSAARAGDAAALAALPQLSHSLDELLADTSGSSVEYALARARLAASLEQTMRITVPAYADGGSHPGGLAIVGDGGGPELVDLGPSRVYSYEQTRSLLSTSDLADQLAALNRRVDRLVEVSEATAGHTADTSDRLRRVFDDDALLIREAD